MRQTMAPMLYKSTSNKQVGWSIIRIDGRRERFLHDRRTTFWRKLRKNVLRAINFLWGVRKVIIVAVLLRAAPAAAQSQGQPVDISRVAGIKISSSVPVRLVAGSTIAVTAISELTGGRGTILTGSSARVYEQ